jgi:hypothetical protein
MTDIVERAREWLKDWGNDCQTCQELISELVAEVERLRDENKSLAEKAIKALEMWRDAKRYKDRAVS